MGACISTHHKASAMKVQKSFGSTNKPVHKPVSMIMDGLVAVKPQLPPNHSVSTFSDYGSKEELFFDSQAWLDSDYEDEFMSVNGDFTPSRGNTPVHQSLISSKSNGFIAQTFSIPTEKRKRLLDFFKESKRENQSSLNEEFAEPPNKHGDGMTSKKDILRLKSTTSMHGCFTGLLSVRSTGRQNKKSPVSGVKSCRSPVVESPLWKFDSHKSCTPSVDKM